MNFSVDRTQHFWQDLLSCANNFDNEKKNRMLFNLKTALTQYRSDDPIVLTLKKIQDAVLENRIHEVSLLVKPYLQSQF